MKQAIESKDAPQKLGPYSPAVRCGDTVYLSGQIGLDPATMQLANGIEAQTHRVFKNLQAVASAAGGNLDQAVKLTLYVTDLNNFAQVNDIMATYFKEPYPARATVEVSKLPRGALIEIDGVLNLA